MTINSKQFLQERFLNTMHDGIVVVDKSGMIRFVNNVALQLLSFNREALNGRSIQDKILIQSDQGQQVNSQELLVDKALHAGTSITIDNDSVEKYFFIRADRSQFPVSVTIMPITPFGDEGVTIVFYDLTTEEKIDKAKSDFVSLVSHQLRTPVNIVSWYVEKLVSEKKGTLNDAQKKYLKEVTISNQRIVKLVAAIVNVSRTDLDRLKNKQEEVDLIAVITEVIHQQSMQIKDRKLIIEQTHDRDVYALHGSDKEYVSVIVANVLNNAVRYSREGGKVLINAQHVAAGTVLDQDEDTIAVRDGVLLSIQDFGLGIPDDQKKQVFTKLFRATNVQALDVTGIGLSLYIARNFVMQLDGNVWFRSKVREGSTFYIYLPY